MEVYSEMTIDQPRTAPRSAGGERVMTDDSLRLYLEDIGKVDLITAEKEVELGTTVQTGLAAEQQLLGAYAFKGVRKFLGDATDYDIPNNDELVTQIKDGRRAHREFTAANLRLVVYMAKNYQTESMSTLDHIQEGNKGLMRAVDKFDPNRGFKFSTYATWWIRQAINRGIAEKERAIRLPVHTNDALNKLQSTRTRLLNENRTDLSPTVLAEESNLSLEKVEQLESLPTVTVSLNQPRGEDGKGELGDVIENTTNRTKPEADMAGVDPEDVIGLLEHLDEDEKFVIIHHFGLKGEEPKSNNKISALMGVPRHVPAIIRKKAFAKMRPGAMAITGKEEHQPRIDSRQINGASLSYIPPQQ